MSRSQRSERLRRWTGMIVVGLLLVGSLAGGARAHASDEHGSTSLHDDEDAPPQTSNGTETGTVELTCEFEAWGYNVTHANGTVQALAANETTTRELETWNGTPNASGGWDLHADNLTLPDAGAYQLFLAMGDNHTTLGHNVTYEPCEEDRDEDRGEVDDPAAEPRDPPACPENLRADARENGDIHLSWDATARAQTYHLYRANETGEFAHLAAAKATSYADRETEGQTTYEYRLVAANEAGEAEDCPTIQATAVPFFGPTASLALAALGSVAVLGVLRRRR